MAAVGLSGYVPVNGQYQDQLEIANIYAQHKKSFSEFDFATPLFALMCHARNKMELSSANKKKWVLDAHVQMIEMAYKGDELKSKIALASGSSLVVALYTIVERGSVFSRDPSAFYKYFSYEGKFIDRLVLNLKKSIQEKDLISMFEMIYWMQFYYLRNETVEGLAEAALNKIFPEESDEKSAYQTLFPIIFQIFDTVDRSYVSFSSKVVEPDTGCCSCFLW